MATDIIDIALHGSSFPASYAGKGTLIGQPYQAAGVVERIDLSFTAAGNAISVPLGFVPRTVRVHNITDGIIWQWFANMPATHTIKTTLGTGTADDTTSAITVTGGDQNSGTGGNQTVTFTAAMLPSGKVCIAEITG